jgi:hypothetical protein
MVQDNLRGEVVDRSHSFEWEWLPAYGRLDHAKIETVRKTLIKI